MIKSKDNYMEIEQRNEININKVLYKRHFEEVMPSDFWNHDYNSHTSKKDKAYTDKDFV